LRIKEVVEDNLRRKKNLTKKSELSFAKTTILFLPEHIFIPRLKNTPQLAVIGQNTLCEQRLD